MLVTSALLGSWITGRFKGEWGRAMFAIVSNAAVFVSLRPLKVGVGLRRSAHPTPLQQPAGEIQKAPGARENPAHSLHWKPLHQGEL